MIIIYLYWKKKNADLMTILDRVTEMHYKRLEIVAFKRTTSENKIVLNT